VGRRECSKADGGRANPTTEGVDAASNWPTFAADRPTYTPLPMHPVLAVVAVVCVAAAVFAMTSRDARTSLAALLLAMVTASVIADPLPDPMGLAARLVGAVLAAYLVRIALRATPALTEGTRVGWPALGLGTAAGFVAGYATHGIAGTPQGPAEAQAAGFALLILAAGPLLAGRDVYRAGVAALLGVIGAGLLRVAVGGTPPGFEELATACLIVTVGMATAILCRAAGRASGDLEIDDSRTTRGGRFGRTPS
jgi:hypothetical protein